MSTFEPNKDFACASILDRVSVAPINKRKKERRKGLVVFVDLEIIIIRRPEKEFWLCIEYVDLAKKELLGCPPDKEFEKRFLFVCWFIHVRFRRASLLVPF